MAMSTTAIWREQFTSATLPNRVWPLFTYTPLSNTAYGAKRIRLLTFNFADPKNGPFAISLRNYDFNDEIPPYSALSYRWGDPKDRLWIACNGCCMRVGRNLYDALIQIQTRQMQRFPGQSFFLWVDAICIDQANVVERNQQVRMMKDIYKGAEAVLIWLGKSQYDSELCAPIIPRLADAYNPEMDFSAGTMATQDLARLGLGMPMDELNRRIRGFYRMLTREWFCRAWIIQEYAVAQTAKFLIGPFEFEDTQVVTASLFLSRTGLILTLDAAWVQDPIIFLQLARIEHRMASKPPLVMLLQRYRWCQATEPQDKIFAFCGLSCNAGFGFTGLSVNIDYRQTPEVLYRKFAIEVLRRDKNLDIVSLAGIHEVSFPFGAKASETQRLNLPSWVTQWHIPDDTPSTQLLEMGLVRRASNLPGVQQSGTSIEVSGDAHGQGFADFKASGHVEYNLRITGDGNGLIVRGILLDSLDAISLVNTLKTEIPYDWWEGASFSELHAEFVRVAQLLNSWLELIGGESAPPYFTGESMLDVLWQTRLSGHCVYRWQETKKDFDDWYNLTRTARKIAVHLHTQPFIRMATLTAYQLYKSFRPDSVYSSIRMRNIIGTGHNKVFFRTSSRARPLVGMTPVGCRAGDWVAIFEGGNVPFVVRQKGNAWEIVGPCYLHGCMQGEVFDRSKCTEFVIV